MRSFSMIVVSLLAGMALSGQASGEVGVPARTVQQAAADALFLQYAPAPPVAGIVCLVDSGVDHNPDTTPILAGSHALFSNTNTEDELAALEPAAAWRAPRRARHLHGDDRGGARQRMGDGRHCSDQRACLQALARADHVCFGVGASVPHAEPASVEPPPAANS